MAMNLGIVGNGNIVNTALDALKNIGEIHVVSICVREQSKNKGELLQKKYGIPYLYTSYENFLCQSDMDFVYIGIINLLHYEYAKMGLLAGKNIILEKPACTKSSEIEDLVRITRERRLYLFEAVTFLHSPFFKRIERALPSLAPIKLAQCNFSKQSSRYSNYLKGEVHPVFDKSMYGGTLFDINIYNINFIVSLLGKPQKIQYYATHGYNGIDLSGILVMQYKDIVASCVAAKDSDSPGFMQIQGEKGWIKIEGSPNNLQNLIIEINGKNKEIISLQTGKNRMIDEFLSFLEISETHDRETMFHYLDISMAVAQVIDAACLSISSL